MQPFLHHYVQGTDSCSDTIGGHWKHIEYDADYNHPPHLGCSSSSKQKLRIAVRMMINPARLKNIRRNPTAMMQVHSTSVRQINIGSRIIFTTSLTSHKIILTILFIISPMPFGYVLASFLMLSNHCSHLPFDSSVIFQLPFRTYHGSLPPHNNCLS